MIDTHQAKWFNHKINIVIHDLENFDKRTISANDSDNTTIISDNGNIHPCIGCFGCWVKTPGQCVINDNTLKLLIELEEHIKKENKQNIPVYTITCVTCENDRVKRTFRDKIF